MATVNFSIEVPEADFKEYLVDELQNLPKDKVQEILLKSIEISLMDEKNNGSKYTRDSNILATKVETYRDGYSNIRYEPTQLLKDVMKSLPTENYLEPVVKEVSDFLKTNYKDIVRNYIVQAFTNMLFTQADRYSIVDEIVSSFNRNS